MGRICRRRLVYLHQTMSALRFVAHLTVESDGSSRTRERDLFHSWKGIMKMAWGLLGLRFTHESNSQHFYQ